LESKCHTGQTIIYDAVGKLGWSVDIRTHRIGTIIDKLLIPDWDKDDGSTSAEVEEQDEQHKSIAQPIAFRQDRSWFSWSWPWPKPRKGRRGHHGDDDLDSGDPDDQPGDGSGNGGRKPKDPKDPAQPPPDSRRPPKSHVPKPQINSECKDCFKWEFFDDFGSTT
jgi:lipase ATG15